MWSLLLVSFLGLNTLAAFAGVPESFSQKNINYRTYIGECPSKSANSFAMIVMKEFEKKNSLKDVKEKILHEKLDKLMNF